MTEQYGIKKARLIAPYPVMSTGKPVSITERGVIRRIAEPVRIKDVPRETVSILIGQEILHSQKSRLDWMLGLRHRSRPYHTYDSAIGRAYRFLKEVVE